MADQRRTWHLDPLTLREVLDDPDDARASLATADPVDRLWLLILLNRIDQAIDEGEELLATAADPFRTTMLLAHAYQRAERWNDAARLHSSALAGVVGRPREAVVRQHVGKRLFDQRRYREALQEFEQALRLRVSLDVDPGLIASSELAVARARELVGLCAATARGCPPTGNVAEPLRPGAVPPPIGRLAP